MNDLFDLSDKVAIVTGSSRGIGFAVARRLGLQGARVVVSSRREQACVEACARLAEEGIEALAVQAHSAKVDDCRRLVEETIRAFGGLDIAVANAGVSPVAVPLDRLDEGGWLKTLDTNLAGPWRFSREALPHLAARGGGSMILVSSINAQRASRNAAAYGISKAAVEALTRQLALEWGAKNVRVNAVAPSTTRTDMIRQLVQDQSFLERVIARTPLGRIAEPDDIAGPICFLAADAARHITGQVLVVDGGESVVRV
jgi:NAD(P)-dependent dehydrogenase (short-subunit alcohol dehydrogenase family)